MARNLLAVLLAALAFASAFHAADAQDFNQGNPECIREDASTGILEAAAEVDELSILVAAVEAAGAQDAFEDTSVKVTAFMPTNEAFNNLVAELGLKNVNELLASPLLPNILRYHVVGDPHTADYFVEGVELPTREGDETLQGYDETTIVAANGNATIMKSDVYTCQGVVEVIDKVMLPPSVFDALEGSSNESAGNSTVAVGGGPPVAGGGGGSDGSGEESDGSGEESDGGHPCTKCPGECVAGPGFTESRGITDEGCSQCADGYEWWPCGGDGAPEGGCICAVDPDPEKGECPDGQGLVDGSDDCVDCGTVLEGSAPNPETGKCECPEGQNPSVDGTKCEESTGLPLPDVCEIGQGLVDGECKDCKDLGQGSFDNQCVECGTVLEGSAPNPDTAQCECPPNQVPSVDGTKCENSTGLPLPDVCEIGQGLVDGECVNCSETGEGSFDNQCVQCNDVLEGSAPDEITAECKCPEGQVPSEDGTKCEYFDPDFGFCPPGQFLNETSGECQRPILLAPRPPLPIVCEIGQGLLNFTCVNCNETGEGSLDNKCVDCGTVLEGSAPNPDTAQCECPPNQIPSVDGTKCECPNGQGLVDGSDDCVDCGTALEGSAPNPDTAQCECPPNQIPSVDGTKCECPNGQGLVDGSDDCVDCDNYLEGSAPNPDTGKCECPHGFGNNGGECVPCILLCESDFCFENCMDCDNYLEGSALEGKKCKCPPNQVPSVDGTKCEDNTGLPLPNVCEIGQGLVDGECKDCSETGQGTLDNQCVDCGTALEGSAPNPDTAQCECPPNQVPSVDGTKCEVEPDTGTDPPPSCLGGATWYAVEERQDDDWCDKNCCAPGCEVESGCCSYENGVSTGGSYDGVHEVCWDENPDPQKFPHWYHGCALCPGFDAGSQEKECLDGQGWIDNPKNCVDCDTVLTHSIPNAETGECECPINKVPNDDGTECIWDPNMPPPFDSSSENGSVGNTICTDPTGCSEEDPTEMPSPTPDMPSLPGSDSASDAAAEETPSIGTPSLPGSDSASDAAAEETPSTTDRPSLLGSDSASDAAAEETPSTTGTPPLPGSDTPTVDAN